MIIELIKDTIRKENYVATGFFVLTSPLWLPLELLGRLVKLLVNTKKDI